MESLFQLRTSLPPLKEIDPFESWEDPDEIKPPILDMDTCPHCFNTDCLYSTDLLTCRSCGHIISRPFDNTAEYRYFAQEDRGGDPTRVGAPQYPRLPEASLGTVILHEYGTAKAMYRVRKYHSWNTITYKETIANAVVDGIIPDKLVKPKEILIKEATNAIPEFIEKLKNKIEEEVLEG